MTDNAQTGRVPDRETFWLVERTGAGQYVKDRSELPALTDDPWRAVRFDTEREAHAFWLRLVSLRDECKPVEHIFINRAITGNAQIAQEPEPEDLAQLLHRVRNGSVDAERDIIEMFNARRKELSAARAQAPIEPISASVENAASSENRNDWKAEALRRFGPIPAGAGENSRLIAAYHYAFIEGAKAALALSSADRCYCHVLPNGYGKCPVCRAPVSSTDRAAPHADVREALEPFRCYCRNQFERSHCAYFKSGSCGRTQHSALARPQEGAEVSRPERGAGDSSVSSHHSAAIENTGK